MTRFIFAAIVACTATAAAAQSQPTNSFVGSQTSNVPGAVQTMVLSQAGAANFATLMQSGVSANQLVALSQRGQLINAAACLQSGGSNQTCIASQVGN